MPRVIVDRPLRWNKRDYPVGVAVDIPADVLDTLPEGVVHQMTPDTPVILMPPPPVEPPSRSASERDEINLKINELRSAVQPPPAATPAQPATTFQPVIRPLQ